MPVKAPEKYDLYESSVQAPAKDLSFLETIYEDLRGFPARTLREDFCGTFRTSYEWVKKNPKNTACAVDLDPSPLDYGRRTHLPRLTSSQRSRLRVLRQNVLSPTREKFDLIIACNFSFFALKERSDLVRYFRACLRSLSSSGVLLLEAAGGPGMEERVQEKKVFSWNGSRYRYVWDQKSFDPITREGQYAIHYMNAKGKPYLKDAFTYDWRIWTLPEIREAMIDAGFRLTCVYWESTHRGRGTGEYLRSEHGDNAWSWIAYPVALRG